MEDALDDSGVPLYDDLGNPLYDPELQLHWGHFRKFQNSECVLGGGHLRPDINVRCDETQVVMEPGEPAGAAGKQNSSCEWPLPYTQDSLEECRRRCDEDSGCQCFTYASNGSDFIRCTGSDLAAATPSAGRESRSTVAYVKRNPAQVKQDIAAAEAQIMEKAQAYAKEAEEIEAQNKAFIEGSKAAEKKLPAAPLLAQAAAKLASTQQPAKKPTAEELMAQCLQKCKGQASCTSRCKELEPNFRSSMAPVAPWPCGQPPLSRTRRSRGRRRAAQLQAFL